jgi:hypothetical protein
MRRVQDDARRATVYDTVIVIPQTCPLAARSHQRGIRIGRARPLIALALVIRSRRPVGIEVALLEQLPARRFLGYCHLCRCERGEMVVHDQTQGRLEGLHRRIGTHLRRVEDQFFAPHEPGRNTLLDDYLEEPAEDGQPEAGTDLTQRGVVGQRLIEVVAGVPTNGEVVPCLLHQLAFRADPFEEHRQLEAEEDFGIDGGSSAGGVAVGSEVAHEREVEDAVEVAIEMILRHVRFEGNKDGTIEISRFRRAEHGAPPFRVD